MSEDAFEFKKLVAELKEIQEARQKIEAKERVIIAQLEALGSTNQDCLFRVGDEIFITNRINHVPRGVVGSILDRAGKVTRIHNKKIYLESFSGYPTWRIEKNLRFLSDQDRKHIAEVLSK